MLSVIILTGNSQKLIEACLKSVSFADEIILVDDSSTDQTVEIGQKMNAKIVQYDRSAGYNFSEARNLGLKNVKGDWVLYLDSDERILEPLKNEILQIVSTDSPGAWQVSRRNIILGQEVRYAAFWPDYVIRFFRKESLTKWQGDVHEQPVFNGPLSSFKNPLLHLTHRDIDSMVRKSLDWANIDANLRLSAGHPPMSGWRFLRIVMTEMWQQGIVRRGFFNGTVGVIDSLLQVFSLYISYVKLWQLQQKPSLDEKYQNIDQKLIDNNFQY